MLPDRDRELLTAYVDGELSARQRRHVQRLLRRSGAARDLLRELKGDSEVLRALPEPPPLDRDLSAPVLRTIAVRRLRPGRRPAAVPAVRRLPAWLGYSAAAAVLCVVGLSAYFAFAAFFGPAGPKVNDPPVAVTPPGPPGHPDRSGRNGERPPDNPIVEKPGPDPEKPVPPENPNGAGPSALVEGIFHLMRPEWPEFLKEWPKEEPEGKVLAAPGREFHELKMVKPHVPAVVPLREADPEPSRRRLVAELRKDNLTACRVELPCNDGNKALHKLQAACKERNVSLVIEGNALALSNKADARPNYVLYLDGVLPEELADLLLALGAADRKGKPIDAQFEMAVLRRLNERDHKELTELLGVDPLADLGPTTPAKAAAGKAAEYQALAVVYNLARPAKGAPEVKRFLEGRKPPRAGSLQVMLVLRAL